MSYLSSDTSLCDCFWPFQLIAVDLQFGLSPFCIIRCSAISPEVASLKEILNCQVA